MTFRRRSPTGRLAAVALVLALYAAEAAFAQAGIPLRLKAGTFDPLLDPAPVSLDVRYAPDQFYIVQFHGPIRDQWKQAVAKAGAQLGQYLPEYAFIAKMSPPVADRVRRLPFVRWVGPLWPGLRISPSLAATQGAIEVVVRIFPGESLQPVTAALAAVGAGITPAGENRLVARLAAPQAAALGSIPASSGSRGAHPCASSTPSAGKSWASSRPGRRSASTAQAR